MQTSKLDWFFRNTFGIDFRALALLRVCTALAILLNLSVRVPDLVSMYSDEGCVPRICAIQLSDLPWQFSIYHSTGNWILVAGLFCVTALLALLLLAGYCTRLVTIASWILVVSLQNRNPMLIDGQDMLLRLMLFWGVFLPWGEFISVDSARSTRPVPEQKTILSLGTFAYTVQILLIYICTAIHKNAPEWRVTGTAALYSLNVDFVTTPLGVYLTNFPEFLRIMTFTTVILEFSCPLLLLVPWWGGTVRMLALTSLIGFHIGLSLVFKLGFFPLVNSLSILPFVPTSVWDIAHQRFRKIGASKALSSWLLQASKSLPPLHSAIPSQQSHFLKKARSVVANVLILFFLAYVITWNAATLPGALFRFPESLRPIADFLRLDQSWFMFASFKPQLNGWYVMPGRLKNGRIVDIFRNGSTVSWERPDCISNDYPNYQWRIYLVALFNHSYLKWRPYYASYLMRSWNETHAPDEQLEELQIYYMYEGLLPEVNPADRNTTKLLVWAEKADAQAAAANDSATKRLIGNQRLSEPLHYAAVNGSLTSVEQLLKQGARINAANERGDTPLLIAIGNKNPAIVRLLIDRGANVDQANDMGTVPLQMAAYTRNVQILNWLIESHASVNAANESGVTALMFAAYAGDLEAVKVLINAGADKNLKNSRGETAEVFARQNKHEKIVELLAN